MKMRLMKRMSRTLRGYLRRRVLANYGVGVVTATKNGMLVVDPMDFNVSRKLLVTGEYDWNEISCLSRLVNAASRIVFVGAHIGSLVVPLTLRARTQTVVAYEPSPHNYRLLLMNLILNGVDVTIAKNIAIGERPGVVRFTENRINTGNGRVARTAGEIKVAIDTLDRTVPGEWDWIDLMVMDIEGSEVDAIRGGTKTLEKTRFLYVEFAPEHLQEQGRTAEEFLERAETHFASVYIMRGDIRHLPSRELQSYLLTLPRRKGFLLNLLFAKNPEPLETITSAAASGS